MYMSPVSSVHLYDDAFLILVMYVMCTLDFMFVVDFVVFVIAKYKVSYCFRIGRYVYCMV